MQARVTRAEGTRMIVEIEGDIGLYRTLAECEEAVQQALNEAGILMTAVALKRFDTDGQSLERDGRKHTSKGKVFKRYETPYGTADVERHVYQHSGGGTTYCPLDDSAGIVLSATPRFARMITSKFAEFGSSRVQEDMDENHGRRFSRGLVAHLAEAVAALAEFQAEQTIYRLPEFGEPIVTLVVAMDEVEISSRPDRAIVAIGSIGFYDADDRRLYTLYLTDLFRLASTSDQHEPARGRFLSRMERELERAVKTQVHDGRVIGVSGGQPWSGEFLQNWKMRQHIDPTGATAIGRNWEMKLFVDPERVMEILSRAAQAYFDRQRPSEQGDEDPQERNRRQRWEKAHWLDAVRGYLRSDGGIETIVAQLKAWLRDPLPDEGSATISEALGLIAREQEASRMNYRDPAAWLVFANGGILDGLVNAVLGDRLNHPKFKIGLSAAKAILILRELTRTPGRWEEFWNRMTRKHGSGA